jgi:hypothetical protein
MEYPMKRFFSYFLACAILAVPATVMAQTPKKTPGASGDAPGQQTGPAKNYAPGQKMLDEDGKPGGPGGASQYAPGQKDTTAPTTKTTPKK